MCLWFGGVEGLVEGRLYFSRLNRGGLQGLILVHGILSLLLLQRLSQEVFRRDELE